MIEPTLFETDDTRIIEVPGFRLAFRWTGDRWTHALEVPCRDGWTPTAVALEDRGEGGTEDRSRVLSPCYQQIHVQRADDRAEVLLVGKLGPHHFSAVFRVIFGTVPAVEVEVADRCRAGCEALAASYAVGFAVVDLVEADSNRLCWKRTDDGDGSGLFRLSLLGPGRIDVREAGRTGCRAQVGAKLDPGESTWQWAYRWEWGIERPTSS